MILQMVCHRKGEFFPVLVITGKSTYYILGISSQ
jgi:hypothetical protein